MRTRVSFAAIFVSLALALVGSSALVGTPPPDAIAEDPVPAGSQRPDGMGATALGPAPDEPVAGRDVPFLLTLAGAHRAPAVTPAPFPELLPATEAGLEAPLGN